MSGGLAVGTDVPREYEGSRACLPDDNGFVERDGVRTYYEVYGTGEPTILFLPTWSIAHSRVWRCQIAYFARHFRVIVFDGRGNGRSDRPTDPAAYTPDQFAYDALAVLEATGTERVVSVSLSAGTAPNILLAALQPERVLGAVFSGPTLYAVSEPFPDWSLVPFEERPATPDAFTGQNRHFITERFREFVEYWTRLAFPEPHSTRAIEFGVGMSLETTPEVLVATLVPPGAERLERSADRLAFAGASLRPLATQIRCPVLVVQGRLDPICLPHWGEALARDTGGELVMIEDAGHHPGGRKPVRFNLELRRFVERVAS